MLEILVTQTMEASPDGRTVRTYEAGRAYEMPPALAEVFVREGWGEEIVPEPEVPEPPRRVARLRMAGDFLLPLLGGAWPGVTVENPIPPDAYLDAVLAGPLPGVLELVLGSGEFAEVPAGAPIPELPLPQLSFTAPPLVSEAASSPADAPPVEEAKSKKGR